MRSLIHRPGPPLAEFVEYLWFFSDAPPHARERIVPNGTLELVINLHADTFCLHEPERRSLAPWSRARTAVRW